jgi:hypothetical protein
VSLLLLFRRTPRGIVALGGTIAPTGAVTPRRIRGVLLAGAITMTGAITKQVNKLLGGTLAPSGTIQKQVNKFFAGVLGLSGTVATLSPSDVVVLFGGTAHGVKRGDAHIADAINDQPRSAVISVEKAREGFVPALGGDVKLQLGPLKTLMAGMIQKTTQTYIGRDANVYTAATVVDYTWLLNAKRVTGLFTGSATTIIQTIISTYAPAFTTVRVEASLPTITITLSEALVSDALRQIMNMVGGDFRVLDTKDIYAFTTPDTSNPPDVLTNLNSRLLAWEQDLSQVRTKVKVTGKSTSARLSGSALPAGSTLIPVADAGFFTPTGSTCKIGNREVATYTSRAVGGTLSKTTGPLTFPVTPAGTRVPGGGRITGTVNYAVSFVITQTDGAGNQVTGESELSADLTMSGNSSVFDWGNNMAAFGFASGGNIPNGTYAYLIVYSTGLGETAGTVAMGTVTAGGSIASITVTGFPDSRVVSAKVYRATGVSTTGPFFYVGQTSISGGTVTDNLPNASLGSPAPNVDASGNRTNTTGDAVTLTLPSGPTGTSARRIWRTGGFTNQRCALATVGGNAVTTYTDGAPDSALGAEAPPWSQMPTLDNFQNMRVRDLAAFPDAGWVTAGGLAISYTGRTATSGEGYLTGIPPGKIVSTLTRTAQIATVTTSTAHGFSTGQRVTMVGALQVEYRGAFVITVTSATTFTFPVLGSPATPATGSIMAYGAGSISTTIAPASDVVAVPFLTLASGTAFPVFDGDPVALYRVRNNVPAQTALAAMIGGDGIYEFPIQNAALDKDAELDAAGDADLADHSNPIKSITFETYDQKCVPGASVTANYTTPFPVTGSFTIQTTDISDLGMYRGNAQGSRVLPLRRCFAAPILKSYDKFMGKLALLDQQP